MFRIRLRNRKSNGKTGRRGSAVLDAALVFPILLLLTFGTVEYGYYFFIKHTMQGAAREGCRAGIVLNNSSTDVTTAVATYLKAAGLNAGSTSLDAKYTLKIEYPQGTTINASALSAGSALFVTLQAQWGTIGQGFRPMALIGSTKTVSGIAVMRKEG
jgi:Flp pilus assembly protein TadG